MLKNAPADAGDTGSIPGSGRCPGEGKDNPLQWVLAWRITWTGAWRAPVLGVTKESTLSDSTTKTTMLILVT